MNPIEKHKKDTIVSWLNSFEASLTQNNRLEEAYQIKRVISLIEKQQKLIDDLRQAWAKSYEAMTAIGRITAQSIRKRGRKGRFVKQSVV